jgi:N-acetylglucosaminyldiphosphoundecaprenol N-acetyl-beta-D-mannosaminyltransferase
MVGGIEVGQLSRAEWVSSIVAHCREPRSPDRQPAYYTSANGNVLSLYARNVEFRAAIDAADGVDADGMPLVQASRLLTRSPIPERCVTTDFFHDVAATAARLGLTFYLLGGCEDVNAETVEIVQRLHPGLKIVGRRNGYFKREEEAAIVADINAAKPDVLWVGLGIPLEQSFVMRNRAALSTVGVVKTCGGLYDYIAGRVTRAPLWMQKCSLEWLYRTIQEPRRLLWRYATTNVHAAWLMLNRTRDLAPPAEGHRLGGVSPGPRG